MKVLIADDSALIRERLQDMLEIYPQVELVGSLKNGIETLKALRTLTPDLAIVDIKMPGISGLEVLTEIRKEDKSIKFIILTLYPSDYYQQIAMEGGADYFFSKVEDFEKMSVIVAKMIEKEENYKLSSN